MQRNRKMFWRCCSMCGVALRRCVSMRKSALVTASEAFKMGGIVAKSTINKTFPLPGWLASSVLPPSQAIADSISKSHPNVEIRLVVPTDDHSWAISVGGAHVQGNHDSVKVSGLSVDAVAIQALQDIFEIKS
eukprot:c18847_g1_i2.p1 GENE.c18847_g1_i2~~c18847_g1_i2.p1  ORF type:complete len:133 (-),score=18.40 c18847_g1_i2:455-853(-)